MAQVQAGEYHPSMRYEHVFVVLAATLGLQACGLVIDFGPNRTVAETTGGAGPGGNGGNGDEGGEGGEGGTGSPAHHCEPDGAVKWLQTFGDIADDAVIAIAPAPNGGAYATGWFQGELSLGETTIVSTGGLDIFVTRFDADGHLLWAKPFGKNLNDAGLPSVLQLPTGVLVELTTNVPFDLGGGEHVPDGIAGAVTLLSPDGDHVWTTWLDGTGDTHRIELARDPTTGDVIVFVVYTEQLQLDGEQLTSNGYGDVALLRLNSETGAVTNSVSFGGIEGDWVQAVEVGEDGRIHIAGSTVGDIDFGQGPLPTLGLADSYAAVLTPEFEIVWARTYPEDNYQHFRDMTLAPDGNMIAVGMMDEAGSVDLGAGPVSGYRDAYLVRISSEDGHIMHGTMIQGVDNPGRVAVDSAGNVVLAGEYEDTMDLDGELFYSVEGWGDPFVVKLTPDFSEVLSHLVITGSYRSEGFRDVFINDEDRVFATGVFHEDLPIEGCTLRRSAGDADAMLLELRN